MSDPAAISRDAFRGAVGSTFRTMDRDAPVILRLAEVAEGRSGGRIEQFSLIFHGPGDRVMQQGTYELEHETLGSLALFLVPLLESNSERMVYEAAFSRLAPK